MTIDEFAQHLSLVTRTLEGQPLDEGLERQLNQQFASGTDWVVSVQKACEQAIAEGWMCQQEAGGIRYGRVLKPSETTHGFSVDVVRMKDLRGPFHAHPNGEIDLVLPLTAGALFDGRGAGWRVYGPQSAHYPTVTEGEALVLYLLPGGAIDFKAKPPVA